MNDYERGESGGGGAISLQCDPGIMRGPRDRRRLERLATTGDSRTIPRLEERPLATRQAARGRRRSQA